MPVCAGGNNLDDSTCIEKIVSDPGTPVACRGDVRVWSGRFVQFFPDFHQHDDFAGRLAGRDKHAGCTGGRVLYLYRRVDMASCQRKAED